MRAALVIFVLVLVAAPARAHAADAADAERDTRSFVRTGSLGVETDIEFYLLEGTYRHDIGSECAVAAGVFPGDREPHVLLRDVLQADLATDGAGPSVGTFEITTAGWANLQVGTGPDCEWAYTITGTFVPVGDEPPPPRPPDDFGGVVGAAIVLVVLLGVVVLVARSRRLRGGTDPGPVVKVWVAPPPE